jgi:hypothetical protein
LAHFFALAEEGGGETDRVSAEDSLGRVVDVVLTGGVDHRLDVDGGSAGCVAASVRAVKAATGLSNDLAVSPTGGGGEVAAELSGNEGLIAGAAGSALAAGALGGAAANVHRLKFGSGHGNSLETSEERRKIEKRKRVDQSMSENTEKRARKAAESASPPRYRQEVNTDARKRGNIPRG